MSLWLASQLHFFSQASVALLRGHTRDTRTKQMCTHEWEWVSRALTVDQERLAEISSNARNTWQMKDYQRDNSNKHDVLCKNKHPPPPIPSGWKPRLKKVMTRRSTRTHYSSSSCRKAQCTPLSAWKMDSTAPENPLELIVAAFERILTLTRHQVWLARLLVNLLVLSNSYYKDGVCCQRFY